VDRIWLAVAAIVRRWYFWIVVAFLALTAVSLLGISRISFKTGQDTIVPASSRVYQDNLRYQASFGGDPILVLFEGDIRRLFQPANIKAIQDLESALLATGDLESVVSPLDVLQFAKDQIPVQSQLVAEHLAAEQTKAAEKARAEAAANGGGAEVQEAAAQQAAADVVAQFSQKRAADARRLAEAGEQSLENPRFVDFLLFDENGAIRPELTGVFPDVLHALMVIRPNGNLSLDDQSAVAGDIATRVRAASFEGVTATPSGPSLLIKEINDKMRESLIRMAIFAVAIMVIVLSLVFRARWQLLSLPVVLFGCVLAFGTMGLVGLDLTMVTISGLPILIGLGVDFAIQFHNREEEEFAKTGHADTALKRALTTVGTALLVALLAATIGFLVLHISRVPMIRDFGSMLAVGTFILFISCLFFLLSLIYWRDHHLQKEDVVAPTHDRVERWVRGIAGASMNRLIPVLALGVTLALLGLFLDRRIPVQTDPEKFVPQDSPVLQDLHRIRDVAGSTGEVNILVEAEDVTDQQVLDWIAMFEEQERQKHPRLARSSSVASMVSTSTGFSPTQEDVRRLLAIAPDGVKRTAVSADLRKANIIFATGDDTLEERKRLLDEIRSEIDPPPGVTAAPAGISVIGVEAVNALSQNRELMVFAALGAILAGFLVIYRSPLKAVAPLLPVLFAVGTSSVVLTLLGIELNPLTSVSGPLIVAMGTEFTVLLMSRYYEERERGQPPREAMNAASLLIGRAITASGLTVMGGFGVLAFSGFPLLEDFGKVTALNIGVALLAALIVLPPILVWADTEREAAPEPQQLRP